MKWNADDNVSIKTEIQCPYYYELASPHPDDESNDNSEKCSLDDSHNGSINRILRSQSMTALPDVKLWPSNDQPHHLSPQPNHLHYNNNDNNSDNINNNHLRVCENGFTFQLDVPPHHEDTSGCSSGYGSAVSSSLSQDYHESLEPDLEAMKHAAQQDDNPNHQTKRQIMVPPLMRRIGSCPNMTQEQQDYFTDITPTTGPSDSPSVSSSETLSWDQLSSCKRTSAKDKLPNIFIDEKGYIRFRYSNY